MQWLPCANQGPRLPAPAGLLPTGTRPLCIACPMAAGARGRAPTCALGSAPRASRRRSTGTSLSRIALCRNVSPAMPDPVPPSLASSRTGLPLPPSLPPRPRSSSWQTRQGGGEPARVCRERAPSGPPAGSGRRSSSPRQSGACHPPTHWRTHQQLGVGLGPVAAGLVLEGHQHAQQVVGAAGPVAAAADAGLAQGGGQGVHSAGRLAVRLERNAHVCRDGGGEEVGAGPNGRRRRLLRRAASHRCRRLKYASGTVPLGVPPVLAPTCDHLARSLGTHRRDSAGAGKPGARRVGLG